MLNGGEVIDVLDLPDSAAASAANATTGAAGAGGTTGGGGATTGGGDASARDDDLPLHEAVARLEKRLILRALERAKGNRSAAARLLGIGRPLLYAKMEEHRIATRAQEPPEPDSAG